MLRILTFLLTLSALGCADNDGPGPIDREQEIRDGEGGNIAHREQADTYLNALKNAASAEQERRAATVLAAWLNDNNYKLQVEEEDGVHTLACPHFPPVTPWIELTFHDPDNLLLLPQQ